MALTLRMALVALAKFSISNCIHDDQANAFLTCEPQVSLPSHVESSQ